MKISIVTPSYNQAEYLGRTFSSVWNQEGDFELEHIVIDGGSTDESIEIIKKYDTLYRDGQFPFKCKTFNFIWLSEQDEGQSDALNKGFSMSSGNILGWLNSDDMFCSNQSLQIVFKAFSEHETADIVLGNTYVIDDNDHIINTPVLTNNINNDDFQKNLKDIIKFDIIMQPSCLFKRKLWETFGISNHYYIMDWVLWIEAYKNNYKFFKIDDYIASYRQQDNAKTVFAATDKDRIINRCKEIISMYKKYNTWCLNRFYYSIFLLLLKSSNIPALGYFFDSFIAIARKARNKIVLRYKLY
jgi:glycosyltransferase involved in cell wall biosynthesis